jgi:CheY-like chemotaxis protein
MSHEIRTPLQSILGYSEQARKQEIPRKEDIDTIYRSSEHLLQIVNEILDYSRIISGKFVFEKKPFELPGLLEEIVQMLETQAQKKNILLELDISGNRAVWLKGDPFRLKQILLNVLGNAIKFTEAGSVSLTACSVEERERWVISFKVKDTGMGISSANMERIFQHFEQAGVQADFGGSGLGLSIVKDLTEAQGGEIKVESTPGRGTLFEISLPFEKAEAVVKSLENNNEVLLPSKEDIVWVVDDDPFILRLCAGILKNSGISHRVFSSPGELLLHELSSAVKYIFMDMRMPGMSGEELCAAIRAREGSGVRLIALTAQALPEEREKIMRGGFDAILMKPFREKEFLACIYRKPLVAATGTKSEYPLLEKMTGGDRGLTKKLLESFVNDTENDLSLLAQASARSDKEEMLLLIHRLAGRSGQIGKKEASQKFREAEKTLINMTDNRHFEGLAASLAKEGALLLEQVRVSLKSRE